MKKYIPHLLGALFVLAIMAVWTLVAAVVKHRETPAEAQEQPTAVVAPDAEPVPLTGGYSEERTPMEEELALFARVYQGEPTLMPLAVATQVVAGTNYRFHCVSAAQEHYLVTIFVPLPCYQDEQPTEVTSIVKQEMSDL